MAPGTVLVEGRQAAFGRHSGVAVEDATHSIWTFDGGEVVRLAFERDRRAALTAAGLAE